jgi:hypothetical protein
MPSEANNNRYENDEQDDMEEQNNIIEINDIRHNVMQRNDMPNLHVYESLTDILNDEECAIYETDLDEGIFEIWLERYPNKVNAIFSDLINLSYDELFDPDVIRRFQELGVDINANGGYHSDAGSTTPLVHACEFRRRFLIESLLICGADVNKKDIHGFSPLDSYIVGHNMRYKPSAENQDQMQIDIETMQRYGLILEAQAWIIEENFENNEDFSFEVRNNFFKNFCDRIEKIDNADNVVDNAEDEIE